MTALIDADSIVYIIASNFKECTDPGDLGVVQDIKKSCASILDSICSFTSADSYAGVFSANFNFRQRQYLYAPYKGSRPAKPDFYNCWAPAIKDHYISTYKFIVPVDLEADDVIAALGLFPDTVICSPDKDFRQVPGVHYNYGTEGKPVVVISQEEASYNFWLQVLTGDKGDNIAGVPGLGDVKARKILDGVDNPILYSTTVTNEFIRYFGGYYGPLIFRQTVDAVQLMGPEHRLWQDYVEQIKRIHSTCVVKIAELVSPFSSGC